MNRTAVFIDAGYLFAAGSMLIAGKKLPRSELNLDNARLFKLIDDLVARLTKFEMLRVYWYDGTGAGPTAQQLAIAYRSSVKLRLGFVNREGEQKGVDSLIVTDLINLARNRAMADVLLLTGDEDIRVGVQQAQEYGVRVHLIGIAPTRKNQSGFLVQEADSVYELSLRDVKSFLKQASSSEKESDEALPKTKTAETFEGIAEGMASELNREEVAAILADSVGGSVPVRIDGRLLTLGTKATGGARLSPSQKRTLRAAFLEACRKKEIK